MPKPIRITLWVVCSLLLLGAVVLLVLYRASQHVPEFYREALAADPVAQEKHSDRMVNETLHLQNNVRAEGRWQAVFTAEEINGWLAVDMPRNHADLLPPQFHDPRVRIEPDGMTLACRVETSRFQGVVSLQVSAHVDSPNVVALRFRKARVGAVPWPVEEVVQRIGEAARQANPDLDVKRVQAGNDPVLLIRLPSTVSKRGGEMRLEGIRLEQGAITISGTTQRGK